MADKNKIQISVTLDAELVAKIDEFADVYGISRAAVVNMLLKTGFDMDYLGLARKLKELKKSKQEREVDVTEGVFAV